MEGEHCQTTMRGLRWLLTRLDPQASAGGGYWPVDRLLARTLLGWQADGRGPVVTSGRMSTGGYYWPADDEVLPCEAVIQHAHHATKIPVIITLKTTSHHLPQANQASSQPGVQ